MKGGGAGFSTGYEEAEENFFRLCASPEELDRVEAKLDKLSRSSPVDRARRAISDQCRRAAEGSGGVYRLNVPTQVIEAGMDSVVQAAGRCNRGGEAEPDARILGQQMQRLTACRIKGSINVQLAEKTGFTEEDAEVLKERLRTLFANDASSARPEGSMEEVRLYWFRHSCKDGQYSSAKVHRSVRAELKDADQFP